jgi:mannose-6-phosphate isomerase-like protein (cupin superfamily)
LLIVFSSSRQLLFFASFALFFAFFALRFFNWNDPMEKVTLESKFAAFSEHWSPKIVGELNGQHVKLVKFVGEFVWHHHDHEDEMFLVHRGQFRMELRERHIELNAGDFLIVPRGVEHRPVAESEVEVILFEPAGTLNTGNVTSDRTVAEPTRL